MVKRFLLDRHGASAVEYGLLVGLLAIAMIAGLTQTGTAIAFLWGNDNSEIQKALNSSR